jgi:predicted Zn finger-like uncharacterized protein
MIRMETIAKMSIVCPRCAVPAALSAEIVGTARRMLRCTRCNTTWFARMHALDPFMKASGGSPCLVARPRFERIVEHDGPSVSRQDRGQAVNPSEGGKVGMSPTARGFRMRRLVGAWFGAIVAVVICSSVTVLALQSAVVGAVPSVDTAQFAGLEIRLISATVEPVHNQNAVIVIGEVANRTNGDLAVPAVRIAVLSGGTERHAWLHQPAQIRLSAGEALTFRSFLTSPSAGVDEVAFRLAPRSNVAAGNN